MHERHTIRTDLENSPNFLLAAPLHALLLHFPDNKTVYKLNICQRRAPKHDVVMAK